MGIVVALLLYRVNAVTVIILLYCRMFNFRSGMLVGCELLYLIV